MDWLLLIIGGLLLFTGLLGSVIPVLPGIPLCWAGCLLLKLTARWGDRLSWNYIWIMAAVVTVITVLDNILPVWGAKKTGGSRRVVLTSTLGMLIGFFFGPIGIILGPFLGALCGALSEGRSLTDSWNQATGAFVGLFLGILLKLICSGLLIWAFLKALLAV